MYITFNIYMKEKEKTIFFYLSFLQVQVFFLSISFFLQLSPPETLFFTRLHSHSDTGIACDRQRAKSLTQLGDTSFHFQHQKTSVHKHTHTQSDSCSVLMTAQKACTYQKGSSSSRRRFLGTFHK